MKTSLLAVAVGAISLGATMTTPGCPPPMEEEQTLTLLLTNTEGIGRAASAESELNGLAFFTADAFETGDEPWVTDGTPEGTRLLKDIWPGVNSSFSGGFKRFKNHVFFIATRRNNDRELWRTDGTEEGTELFVEFVPGRGGIDFAFLDVVGDKMYVMVKIAQVGEPDFYELWVLDGDNPPGHRP